MEGLSVVLIRAAGESGALYGSVSARDIAVYQLPATGIVLSADGTLLRRFLVEQPTVIGTASTTPAIIGITAGEVLVGIDGRE